MKPNNTILIFFNFTLLVWAYCLILPYQPFWLYSAYTYEYRRVFVLFLSLFIIIIFLFNKSIQNIIYQSYQRLPYYIKLAIYGFFIIGILASFFNAILFENAIAQLTYYWGLFILFLFLSDYFINNKKAITHLLMCLVIMCLIYEFIAILNLIFFLIDIHINEIYQNLKAREFIAAPHFMNLRFLNQFQSWILPLLTLAYFHFNNHQRVKRLAFIALCLFWYLTIISSSRAFILEYMILIPILFFIDRKNTYKYIKITLVTFFIGYIFYFISQELLMTSAGKLVLERDIMADSARKLLWTIAFDAFQSSPIIGIGPLQYPTYIINISTKAAHPHNIYLQVLAEFGLTGFFCFLFILIYSAYKYLKLCFQNKSMTNLLILASLLCGFIHAGLSGVFVMPLSQLTAVIVFALAFSQCNTNTCPPIHNNFIVQRNLSKSHKILFYILTLVMGIGLSITAGKQAITYPEHSKNCKKICYLNPNFWSNGWYGIDENIVVINKNN